MSKILTYSELVRISSFEERVSYLRLYGIVGSETFGIERIFNQRFYKSLEWRRIRREIVLRDDGCDLGVDGREIVGPILVHHMNPITILDIETLSDILLNPEYLICVSHNTHNFIHYGTKTNQLLPCERRPNDTIPWR